MLREVLLSVSRSDAIRRVVETAPVSKDVVVRFVAGTRAEDAVAATGRLIGVGLTATIDHLGEDTLDIAQAENTRDAYLTLLSQLADAGLTRGAEVSVKLSAVGQALPEDGEEIALENAYKICEAAKGAGTTVTLDMEDHTTTDSTLNVLRELRKDFPWVGAVLQTYLHRTESDCRDLAYEGSRVRLCKGAYKEPGTVAFQEKLDVDKSYVRCMKILMAGKGYPMLATHDPRLIEIAGTIAAYNRRDPGSYEMQMLYGIRPEEQLRLVGAGQTVRVYVPYGEEWYGYLVRRLAERPANVGFFARALVSKR